MEALLFLNLGGPEVVLILVFGLVPLALMAFCLIDIVRSTFKDSTVKLLWGLIVLFAPVLGSLIYLLIGRNQRIIS